MVRILLTGYTDVDSLIEAINTGRVYKYITKPWNNDDLLLTVARALEHYETRKSRHNLQMINERLRARLREISDLAATDDELLSVGAEAPLELSWELSARVV
jgi:FixJ family two-component response regulator